MQSFIEFNEDKALNMICFSNSNRGYVIKNKTIVYRDIAISFNSLKELEGKLNAIFPQIYFNTKKAGVLQNTRFFNKVA